MTIDKSVKPTTRVQTYLSKQIMSKIVNKEYSNKSVSINTRVLGRGFIRYYREHKHKIHIPLFTLTLNS